MHGMRPRDDAVRLRLTATFEPNERRRWIADCGQPHSRLRRSSPHPTVSALHTLQAPQAGEGAYSRAVAASAFASASAVAVVIAVAVAVAVALESIEPHHDEHP